MAITVRKIFRNESGSDLIILNKIVADGDSYEPEHQYWSDVANSSVVNALITSGDLVLNDGSSDLSPSDAFLWLKRWQKDEGSDISFNNISNGFTATNLQTAVEEVYSSAIAKPRFSIITTFNGTIGNGDWLGYSELIAGDQVPIRIPRNCKLQEITVSYKNTSLLGIPTGSNLIDGTFRVYKNGLINPTNVVISNQFINQANGKVITGLNVPLNQGDFIVGRWIDEGDNPSDMAVCYFFEVT